MVDQFLVHRSRVEALLPWNLLNQRLATQRGEMAVFLAVVGRAVVRQRFATDLLGGFHPVGW